MPPLINPTTLPIAPRDNDAEARAKCQATGGVWDSKNKICIPKEKPIETEKPIGTSPEKELELFGTPEEQATKKQAEQVATEFNVLRDETGRLSGFTKGGQTFLGLSPGEVRGLAELEAGRQELEVGGAAESALAKQAEKLQRQGLDLSAQVGQDPINQLRAQFSAQSVNYVAAIATGAPDIIPNLITGATTGATGAFVLGQLGPQAATPEEVITVPTAAVILGVANAVKGFYSDFVSDVRKQKGELVETPIRTLTETKSIMNDITSAQNANPAEAIENLEAFNSQLQLLDDEFDRLKDLTDDDLNKFLGVNGINQLQEFEVYYTPNGERDRQIRDFQLALANPDPSVIRVGGDTLRQLKSRIEKELKKNE